eukprot:4409185-Prymnesium_polylepis.1
MVVRGTARDALVERRPRMLVKAAELAKAAARRRRSDERVHARRGRQHLLQLSKLHVRCDEVGERLPARLMKTPALPVDE